VRLTFTVAAHKHTLVRHNGSIWINWVNKHTEYAKFLKSDEFCHSLVDELFAKDADLPTRENAIQLVVSLGDSAHRLSEIFWERCTQALRTIDIKQCLQVDERTVGIFKTSEGTLFNTDVIEQ